MRHTFLATFLLAAIPTHSFADQTDRLVAASMAISTKFNAFVIGRVPELADKLPVYTAEELDGPIDCMIRSIGEEAGPDAVERYVASMEEIANTIEIKSFTQASEATGDIDEEVAARALQACGQMDLSMQKMQESGFLEAIMQPGVMDRLTADE